MSLWKYILNYQRDPDKGFTIPLILGLGLFMLLTGVTAILNGSESETNSKVQKTTAQATSAAEIGLARIQALIDANRDLAVFNDCVTRNGNGDCTDTGDVASWHNAQAIIDLSTTNVCGNLVSNEDLTLIDALVSSSEWLDIDTFTTDGYDKGQFRLVSYSYPDSANNRPPGVAELIVEGRTSQGSSGATSASEAYNTGIVRLRAEIPVYENPSTTTDTVPGLWINFQNATNMGNDKINGDIKVAGCAVPSGIKDTNIYDDGDPNTPLPQVYFNPDPLPATPSLPDREYLIGDTVPSADNTPANDPVIADAFAVGNFPRDGDDPAPDGYYHYLIQAMDASGGKDITIDDGAKVIFYVQGDIAFGGSLTVNKYSANCARTTGSCPDTTNSPANLQIYGNTTIATSSYKYGCPSGIVCPTRFVFFNGTGEIRALIHAPEATGGVAGGGNAEGQVKGTLWINDWNAASGSSKVKVDAIGSLGDLISATTAITIQPQISVSSSYVRQEVPD